MIPTPDELFFRRADMDERRVAGIVGDALVGANDGELFLEYGHSEAFTFDDGRLRNADYNIVQGLGLRRVVEDATAYAHTSELSEAAVRRAAKTVRAIGGRDGRLDAGPPPTNRRLYGDESPLDELPHAEKVGLLREIDAYLRGKDDRVHQVTASLRADWRVVCILRADGSKVTDVRPLVRLDIGCVLRDGDRMEAGSHGVGGRVPYGEFVAPERWKAQGR